jgi:type VI secretion system secreted protein Hcp
LLAANAGSIGQVTIGSGGAALTFPILAADEAGSAPGRSGSAKTTFHTLSITKTLDKSSPNLFQLTATGKHIPTVRLEYAKAAAGGKHLEITLSNVVISADQTQPSAADKASPHETITFEYGAIKLTYTQQKP